VRALDHAELTVAALNLHQPSLEDVFLAKTGHPLQSASAHTDGSPVGETVPHA
jgi:hypothetical protein